MQEQQKRLQDTTNMSRTEQKRLPKKGGKEGKKAAQYYYILLGNEDRTFAAAPLVLAFDVYDEARDETTPPLGKFLVHVPGTAGRAEGVARRQ